MHQDGIHCLIETNMSSHRRHMMPEHAPWRTRVHIITACSRSEDVISWDVPRHTNLRWRNAIYFFLITWKWKGTKPSILQAVKLPSSWIREWNRPSVTGSQGPQGWPLGGMVPLEVHGLTLLLLGPLCSNTGSLFSVIFHHEGSVSMLKANIDQINLIKLGTWSVTWM